MTTRQMHCPACSDTPSQPTLYCDSKCRTIHRLSDKLAAALDRESRMAEELRHLEVGLHTYRLLVRVQEDGRGGVYTETNNNHARAVQAWESDEIGVQG